MRLKAFLLILETQVTLTLFSALCGANITVIKLTLVLSVHGKNNTRELVKASNAEQYFQARPACWTVASHTSLRHWTLKLSPSLQAAASSRACFFCVLREDSSSYMVVRLNSTLSCR